MNEDYMEGLIHGVEAMRKQRDLLFKMCVKLGACLRYLNGQKEVKHPYSNATLSELDLLLSECEKDLADFLKLHKID